MNLRILAGSSLKKTKPRTCGDEPKVLNKIFYKEHKTPHMRG